MKLFGRERDMGEIVDRMLRTEYKYILTKAQTEYFESAIAGNVQADAFGLTPVLSLYYDTPDRRLVRTSLEKPEFKEKIRLRSYGLATAFSPVYLELKRKAQGVVYKRRIETTVEAAKNFFGAKQDLADSQIAREIAYFRDFYGTLQPSCLILYDRTAYTAPEHDLRVTVDHNPRYRFEDADLTSSLDGIPLLAMGETILEIKTLDAIPLWLCHVLDGGEIRKTSFSKYGTAFTYKIGNEIRKAS